ncbi:MAG: VOC family protein [Pseudomonadota bacterium]
MIDHVNIPVSDLTDAQAFFDAVLAELDMTILAKDGPALGYGTSAWTFGIVLDEGAIQPLHVAFVAKSHAVVRAFHAAGLAAGGSCNGAPGVRPHYGARYYAAFLTGPDGHNIEAVCRD